VTAPLRALGVRYLNARPLYHGMDRDDGVRLELGLPGEVARRLAEDEGDVALMPLAAAAALGEMEIVPDVAIACRGAVRSVVIVGERPLHELDEIALDLSSRTSVVLTRLLLGARVKGREPRLVGLEAREAERFAVGRRGALLIGDRGLEARSRFPHVLDLGEAWLEHTGLPFVFAAWFARAGTLDARAVERIQRAKVEGLAARREIAEAHRAAVGAPSSAPYLDYLENAVCHDLGEEERRGMERFLHDAEREGLLPRASLRFVGARAVQVPPSIDGILSRAAEGQRLSAAEGERLLTEAALFDLGLAADAVRRRKHPDGVVTYIVDRNVNYTNVCTTSCRFCAFYRPVGHPEAYVLSREELAKKLKEVKDAGGVQILLQGGLNPELRIEWYEELFRWIKAEYGLGLHALSPEEILHLAELEGLTVERVLERLHAAGLDSVPGGGAEILVDRVRRRIAKAKCTSEQWLGVMRLAHRMGLRSSATMMYGTVDGPRDRILHLLKLRDLQDETAGFTAFFCWDYQHEEGTRIAPGDGGTQLYLRMQAVSRLLLDNIDHVGASWVTQGPEVGQVALRFGADDFGSVMFEENVVSSAGTTFRIDAEEIERRIREAGFKAARRNVRYEWLTAPA
jgi:cyclic dehypoxanthinyl futalosine synthase